MDGCVSQRNRPVMCAAGDTIALEYSQPAMPLPGQAETAPILRVASVMQVRDSKVMLLK